MSATEIELSTWSRKPFAERLSSAEQGNAALLPSSLRDSHVQRAVTALPRLPSSPDLSRVSTRSPTPAASHTDLVELASEHASAALPPADTGRGAWTYLAAATVFESTFAGYIFSFSIFQDYLPTIYDASTVTISAIGTVSIAFVYSMGIFIAPVCNRWPEATLPLLYVCFAVAVLSLLASSWSTSIYQLIVLQGVIYSACVGAIYVPIVLYMYQWFKVKRGQAWGTVCAGGALGGFAIPLVLGTLLGKIGYANTLRVWAVFLAVSGSIALLGFKPREPLPPRGSPRPPLIPRNIGWMLQPLFVTCMATVALQSLSYFSISVFISPFVSSLHYSPVYAHLALAVFNFSAALGQIICGFVADRRPYPLVMLATTLLCSILALVVFGFADSLPLVFFFVICYGAASGGFASAWPAASVSVVGKKWAGAELLAFEFLALACVIIIVEQRFNLFLSSTNRKGLSGVLGPTIAAALQTPTDVRSVYGQYGYERLTLFVGGTMLLASIGAFLTQTMDKRKKAREDGS